MNTKQCNDVGLGYITCKSISSHLHDEGLVFCLVGESIDNQHIFTFQRIFSGFTSNKATSFSSSTILFPNWKNKKYIPTSNFSMLLANDSVDKFSLPSQFSVQHSGHA